MTPAEIVTKIKTLGHDLTMPDERVYDFINMALKDIESRGDYSWQTVKETVTVPAGSQTITTAHTPVKHIIATDPVVEIVTYVGTIQLKKAVTEDTDITIVYSYKHPEIDGATINKIMNNDWLYILGGLYYMLLFNMSPEAGVYQQKFIQEINREYAENCFVVDTDVINREIGGI